MPREVELAHVDDTVTLPIPLENSVGNSISSTSSARKTDPPLREPSARSVRRLKRQATPEAAGIGAAVASVAAAVNQSTAAVASSNDFAPALHSAINSAVASVAIAVTTAGNK